MDKHTRIKPWLTLPILLGNAIQISGLLGGVLLARRAATLGRRGTGWLYSGRLLAYFCEHAFSHYAVGRLSGIRFTSYGLHGSTHTHLYPPGNALGICTPAVPERADRPGIVLRGCPSSPGGQVSCWPIGNGSYQHSFPCIWHHPRYRAGTGAADRLQPVDAGHADRRGATPAQRPSSCLACDPAR